MIEIKESQLKNFIRPLVKEMVEGLQRDVRSPQAVSFTLEKPPGTKVKKPGMKMGPVVYRSKDVDFSLKENRVKETRGMVRKKAKERKVSLRKAATMLTVNDFKKNGLGLIMNRLRNSPYRAVAEAFPEFDLKPWEMVRVGNGFWQTKQNRNAAFHWLLGRTGKKTLEMDIKTMIASGLEGLYDYYKGMGRMFVDLGFVYNLTSPV